MILLSLLHALAGAPLFATWADTSFEQGWYCPLAVDTTGGTHATCTLSEGTAYLGTHWARVEVDSARDSGRVFFRMNLLISDPGVPVRIRFAYRGPGGLAYGIRPYEEDKIPFFYPGRTKPSPEWTIQELRTRIPVYGPRVRPTIQLQFIFPAGKGVHEFDAVSAEILGEDSAWSRDADKRIDSLRRSSTRLLVRDANGTPVADQPFEVRLVRHAFPLGTAVRQGLKPWEREVARRHFWSYVPENDFKWPNYERVEGQPDTASIASWLAFADSNRADLRGHTLVWAWQGGMGDTSFKAFWGTNLATHTCSELAANLKMRIERDLAKWKGRIREYDVWNEPMAEQRFTSQCGVDPRFAPDGLGLIDSAFIWARRADPMAKLYINDFYVVNEGDRTLQYYKLIRAMRARGVPIDGIGVQGHNTDQDYPGTDWRRVEYGLSLLGSLGLPIKITELDVGNWGLYKGTEALQASLLTGQLRWYFSHPAVTGIFFWGFSDGAHWLTDGGMWRADGSRKPMADSLVRLWDSVWTTKATLRTDGSGGASLLGFRGRYEVLLPGETEPAGTFELTADQPTTEIRLARDIPTSAAARPQLRWQVRSLSGGRLEVEGSAGLSIRILDVRGRTLAQGETAQGSWRSPALPTGLVLVESRGPGWHRADRVLIRR